ncbi:MAG: hypothetical protein IPM32_03680 [Ignavibacteriae bacterium]|nr:hypothetical protein [Ignavibacteriota bacterium]
MENTIILIGGFYNLAFATFHLLFWKIFKWNKELKRMNFVNGNILQILNLSITFVFIIFAFLSFFYAKELVTTQLGNSILRLISFFWFFRSLQQIYFFGLKNITSVLFFIGFLIGVGIYIYPTL